ncbi:TOM1-like protein 1 isoform X2 [Trichosurus vulpecula]|uniref:TOM1-like protein 1 isoform X2 n=1 Tax=Trichosurus vulpecula TaxID=9337 RepID=UPI00186AC701|nr:TOM1-like protein 1 isoform X2 [Trichosurus vulpecula]
MAFGKSHKDPFGTSVGHLIEKATFAGVQTEDWGQFMHICDVIITSKDGPKEAVRALKKRISKNCNHKEIQLTLSLIDMCMQNCGPSFQALIVKKDFTKDHLVKLLSPRYNLPLDIQNKILSFIMTWSRGFPGGVDVSEVKEIYLELLKKGVQFPSSEQEIGTEKDMTLSPSITKPPPFVPSPSVHASTAAPKAPTILLVAEQIGKLHSEVDMVKMNVKVMSAILTENTPGSENQEDMQLLEKLYKTGRDMQERIMDLLAVVENEDVTMELIQVNEDLNQALLGYERFSRNQKRFQEQKQSQEEAQKNNCEPSAPSCDLLDLSPGPSSLTSGLPLEGVCAMSSQFSGLNVSSSRSIDANHPNPMLHSQLDLLASENPEISLFPQRTDQNISSGHLYDNILTHLNPILMQPVNLQAGHAGLSSHRPPASSSNQPARNDLQPPSYYEVMEFDPLAPGATTEALYEDIDANFRKPIQNHTNV